MLLRTRIDLDNHIRGVLKAFGLKVGKVATGQFEARVWELIDEGDAQIRWIVGTMLTTRAACQCRTNFPQKRRSKFPQVAAWGDQVLAVGSLGLGGLPRRRDGGSGGVMRALERMCSGTSSAC